MKRNPAGAGSDDDPRRRWDRRRGGPRGSGVSSYPSSAAVRIVVSAHSGRPCLPRRTAESADLPNCRVKSDFTKPSVGVMVSSHLAQGCLKWAELGTEAAETLRSPSGGVPVARGEAAATSERSERERQAVRFAVGAVCCGVVGCQRSDGLLRVETSDGPRVLCSAHLRRWGE